MKELKLIDRYCAVWNELDITSRRNLLKEIWAENGKYVDPRSNLVGVEELVNHIGKIQSSRSGTKVMRTSKLDIHHHIGRFNWHLIDKDGLILLEGLDIVHFNKDVSEIEKILGFFGELKDINQSI